MHFIPVYTLWSPFKKRKNHKKALSIFRSITRGVSKNKISTNRPRKSTDLEEYIILEPKKIFQLQKFKKLWRAPFGEKREDFFIFYRIMLGLNTRFARFDLTVGDAPLKDYSLLGLRVLHGFENIGYNDCFHVEIGILSAETVFRHSI